MQQKEHKKGKFKQKPEFEQQIVDLARVTRVTKGGKQLSFRAVVIIGDRRGRVGYGIEKGKDVQLASDKAYEHAKKNLITVPIVNEGTLPHIVYAKFKAAKIMIKPAPVGSGLIAGSVVRTILDMAGVQNASAKVIGKTNNKITNAKAVFKALSSFREDKKIGNVKKEETKTAVAEPKKRKVVKKTKEEKE